MPNSLSHVVIFTDDLDDLVRFLTDIARFTALTSYEVPADTSHMLFGWPPEVPAARAAFVGEGPGSVDVIEIPMALRGTIRPGVRLLAAVNRDVVAVTEAAAAVGYEVRGPFQTTAATGRPMSLVEVVAGGVAFELVEFG